MSPSAGPGGTLLESTGPLAGQHDVLLLDLDGTVWLSGDLIPHALPVLTRLAADGIRPVYVTNNASRSAADVASQLRAGGLPATEADVVTSGQASAAMLAGLIPAGANVLVVGSSALVEQVTAHGLNPIRAAQVTGAELREPGPDGTCRIAGVVQGLATDTGWPDLAAASHAVAAGAVWVAANVDATLPTPHGLSPGNGSLVAVVATVTGRSPLIAGKPERPLIDAAVQRTGARAPLVIGDRLDTDLAAAVATELPGLLVFTGVSDPAALLDAVPAQRPGYLAPDLRGLLRAHPAPRRTDGGWVCGGWQAAVHDGHAEVRRTDRENSGDGLDGLRALAEAVWEHTDAGGGPLAEVAECLASVLEGATDPAVPEPAVAEPAVPEPAVPEPAVPELAAAGGGR